MNLSIITINYNNANGLDKTINSIISQLTEDVEYLVIDGFSTDDSTHIIAKYHDKIDYWISEKDKGIYDAMNKGIVKAKGKYLMFLNSGDCLADSGVLAKCLTAIHENDTVDVFYGDMLVVNHGGRTPWVKKYLSVLPLSFLRHDTLNHQSSLISGKLFDEFGLYPQNYKLASDYWLFLIAFLHHKVFRHLGNVIAEYDLSGISATSSTKYWAEHDKIWHELVPRLLQDVVAQELEYKETLNSYETLMSTRIVKLGIKTNGIYQAIRSFLRNTIKK